MINSLLVLLRFLNMEIESYQHNPILMIVVMKQWETEVLFRLNKGLEVIQI